MLIPALLLISSFQTDLQAKVDACHVGGACIIELAEGTFDLERTIDLCPRVKIRGQGSQYTTIRTTSSTTAFHVMPYTRCKADGKTWQGNVAFEGLAIVGKEPVYPNATRGILAENHVRGRDLHIRFFTVGLEISADVTRDDLRAGNSNGWRFDDVRIQNAAHAGAWFHGGDSNTGVWIGGGASSNCQDAGTWNDIVGIPCAGIAERSFLGNTLIGVHTAANWDHLPGCRSDSASCVEQRYPGFDFTGLNQRSVCLGCYSEGDQAQSLLSPWSIAAGGVSSWTGTGMRMEGRRLKLGVEIVNDLDPLNITTMKFGAATGMGGVFFAASASGITNSWPLRMKADPVAKEFRFDVANLGAAVTARIVGHTTNPGNLPIGTIRLKSTLLRTE